jgi:phosphoglycolate phosphatase
MELTRPKAILFDWDNTLVNTWPVIHAALHKTFVEMGREPWPIEVVKQRVARSMRDSFPTIFGNDWQKAGEIYQEHFRSTHLQNLEALPGASDMLAWLSKQPVYVAVVSNKKGVNLRAEAEHIGWSPYFRKVVGASDTANDKPSADPVLAALKDSGIAAGRDVWFIGDSAIDMECAHATGCVPVWYGELPFEPLKYPFSKSVANHAELKELLASRIKSPVS